MKPFWFHQTLEYTIKSMQRRFFGLMAPPCSSISDILEYTVTAHFKGYVICDLEVQVKRHFIDKVITSRGKWRNACKKDDTGLSKFALQSFFCHSSQSKIRLRRAKMRKSEFHQSYLH